MKKFTFISLCVVSLNLAAAEFEIFKSPSCGCCQNWTEALEQQGHQVKVHHTDNLNKIKFDAGLPRGLESCHTAFVDGYVVEGHVPLQAIEEMLKNKPDIKGIAVPGMPAESLGMEYGGEPQKYIVYSIDQDGNTAPLSTYKGMNRVE